MTVSPVTRCVLAEPLIDEGDAVFLVRVNWPRLSSGTRAANSPRCAQTQNLGSSSCAETGLYKLVVTSEITDLTELLQFYRHSPDTNVTHYQADFGREAFEPTWRTTVPAQWFATLRQVWTDKWFAELGRFNQITRKNNAVLEGKSNK